MIIIEAKFSGEQRNLEMFLNTGIKNYSTKFLGLNNLNITWQLEETNYLKAKEECMSFINTKMMDLWDIEFKNIL
ncbi:MAG: hypothetical protein ACOYMA_07420 [Bacteroidia bacterium]